MTRTEFNVVLNSMGEYLNLMRPYLIDIQLQEAECLLWVMAERNDEVCDFDLDCLRDLRDVLPYGHA